MTNKQFQQMCIELVRKYTNEHLDNMREMITNEDVYIVWYCKTLQNHKALLSTSLPNKMYYEITYNGDKNEIYFDGYRKVENICVR